jgi:hypothetical protein
MRPEKKLVTGYSAKKDLVSPRLRRARIRKGTAFLGFQFAPSMNLGRGWLRAFR